MSFIKKTLGSLERASDEVSTGAVQQPQRDKVLAQKLALHHHRIRICGGARHAMIQGYEQRQIDPTNQPVN